MRKQNPVGAKRAIKAARQLDRWANSPIMQRKCGRLGKALIEAWQSKCASTNGKKAA